MKRRTNLEILIIIVAAWNLSMADANAICSKTDINENFIKLLSFMTGDENVYDIISTKDEYANQCIEHYENFKELSKQTNYTKWKSLSKNSLIKTYGVLFDIYMANGFNTDFLQKITFFKLTERQLAKIFIKIKQKL